MEVRIPSYSNDGMLSDPETPTCSSTSSVTHDGAGEMDELAHTPPRQRTRTHLFSNSQLSPAEAGLLSGIDSESGGEDGFNDGLLGSENGSGTGQHNRSGLFKVEHAGGGSNDGREETHTPILMDATKRQQHHRDTFNTYESLNAAAVDFYGEDSDFSYDSAEHSTLNETMDETMREDEVVRLRHSIISLSSSKLLCSFSLRHNPSSFPCTFLTKSHLTYDYPDKMCNGVGGDVVPDFLPTFAGFIYIYT